VDERIEQFVKSEGIAVVGVSDKKFGGAVYKTLKKYGYPVYAVNPVRETFEGDKCYPDLRAVPAEVKAAVIAVSKETAEKVVDDAKAAGISQLWFQMGQNYSKAIAAAEAAGMSVISRKCILMYAEPVKGIHVFHRFLARLFGRL
jgi:predicted CoA-binding protein